MSESLENMLSILRKYHSIARKSRSQTNLLLFSQELKTSCDSFNQIKNDMTEELLKNIILKGKVSGFYQVTEQEALIIFMKTIKELKSFKFGEYYFSSSDIFIFFNNLRQFLKKGKESKQLNSLYIFFEKLQLL